MCAVRLVLLRGLVLLAALTGGEAADFCGAVLATRPKALATWFLTITSSSSPRTMCCSCSGSREMISAQRVGAHAQRDCEEPDW